MYIYGTGERGKGQSSWEGQSKGEFLVSEEPLVMLNLAPIPPSACSPPLWIQREAIVFCTTHPRPAPTQARVVRGTFGPEPVIDSFLPTPF
ncbi:hypothetical protein Moror_7120 [Moniliophthora roreri MCA 2997]|uniref:Uncharacterized protein n=1 Tax=Moniliophthora roreri (strain MCA 2997) TaxID=1381753 RepID=V2YXA1_MONRO|nr:hypothetical protein Moror_7120 [Moniliophthora roreri MCA 2997]